jgi:hypothetical protein
MSSYQGLSKNNVTAKNSGFQSERDLKRIFISELLLNRQNIIEIEKILSGSVHNNIKILERSKSRFKLGVLEICRIKQNKGGLNKCKDTEKLDPIIFWDHRSNK